MVRNKGVAYYGVFSPSKAIIDYRNMLDHGVNLILYEVSEFDFYFWRNGLIKIIEKAKEMGFRICLSPWGWGGIFGEGPPSLYLHKHSEGRQVSAVRGKKLNVACFNCEEFKNYIVTCIERLSEESEADCFLWQEPGYRVLDDDWSCRCECCRNAFRSKYGYEMPDRLTSDVVEFREKMLVKFIRDISRAVKVADSKKKVALCLPPRLSIKLGVRSWNKVLEIKELDVLGVSLYRKYVSKEEEFKWLKDSAKLLASAIRAKGKESIALIQGFNIPKGHEEDVIKTIKLLSEADFTSIVLWPYRAGENSLLESGDPEKLWNLIGKIYREIK